MSLVQSEEVTDRLPEHVLPLSNHDENRVTAFLDDAEELIRDAFLRAGRDLDVEMLVVPWLQRAVVRSVREMVAASVVVGPNVGLQRASSTTGPQSDSADYRDVPMVSFSGPKLTDELRDDLGLPVTVRSVGKFPRSKPWPERGLR